VGRTLESCRGMTVLEALGDSPVAHQSSEAIGRVQTLKRLLPTA
jgi:hypothetical protein